MDFLLLGPVEVRDNGQAIPLGGPRQRSVLALLLLHPNRPLPADRLLDELWGDPGAKNALEAAVSRLRRGPLRGRLMTQPSGYVLRVDPGEIDVVRFERALAEGRDALAAGDAAHASQTLRSALALFRDEPLADLRYEPFAQGEIARLEELRLQAVEERIEADLLLGRHGELVGELEPLAAAQPLRERMTAQLMLALYRSGRQAEALDVYRATRERLVEELGLEPGPALRELEHAILRQDASLSAPTRQFAERGTHEPVREVRKLVTIFFAGLADAAALAERLDAEALRTVLARQVALAEQAVARHGGTLERHIGDTLMAVFGVPSLHEDDALRAVRAATELRDGFDTLTDELARELGVRPRLRIGVRTGEVIAADPAAAQAFLTGEPVLSAALLLETAGPGEILVDETTRGLVGTAVRVEPVEPAQDETVAAWRLLGLIRYARPSARRLDVPLVGREADLDRLETLLRRAVRERGPRLVTVLGVAGIGKSRLAQELVAGVGSDVRVLEGRCLPYGEGVTFWALRELVLQLTGRADLQSGLLDVLADADEADWIAERILGAVGLGETIAPIEEVFAATRKLLESLAHRQPLLLVFEDVHWAEPAFLDLLEHVVQFARDVPMLVVCLARPELLEDRPEWGPRASHSTVVEIDRLSDDDAERLLDSLGAGEHRTTIKLAAEGNPLFLEQIVAWLAESRLIEGELPLPPTIQAILASRLERLGPGERALLDCVAVIGRDLWEDAVLELVPAGARAAVPRHLEALVSKQFLRPAATPVRGEQAFRFRHILIQAAAYRAVPKETRARLHERFADWLERHYQQRLSEVEELVGYHLEQAHRYRTELSPMDPDAVGLARRASERLAAAGARAVARADVHAAASLLSRTVALLPRRDPHRLALLPDLGESLAEAGRLEEGRAVLQEAVEVAREIGNRAIEWRALAADGWWRLRIDRAPATEMEQLARDAIRALDEIDDDRGLAKAWRLLGEIHHSRGEYVRTCEATERAFEHARRAGDRHEQFMSLAVLGASMFWGATPVDEGIRRLIAIEAAVGDDPPLMAAALRPLGGFRALQGHVDEGRRLVDRARAILEELGFRWAIAAISFFSGHIERLAGDLEAAEREFRNGVQLWDEMGELGAQFTMLAELADVLYEQGRYGEAADAARRVLALRMADLEEEAHGGAVLSKTLARRGDFEEAERVARSTVTLTDGCDSVHLRTRSLLALAEVLELAGSSAEAAGTAREALRLYEAKGDVLSARRTRERLARLEATREPV